MLPASSKITVMGKKTDYRFKLLYCIGIIMVVLGHCQGGSIHILDNWFPLGGMHLMLFVFASGYFYSLDAVEHIGGYLLKKLKKLAVPLFFYNVFYGLFASFMQKRGFYFGSRLTLKSLLIDPITSGHQFAYNMGSWFVVPLLMCEVYNVCLRYLLKKVRISETLYFIFNLILGIAGIELAILGYNYGWYLPLVRFLYFLPFYSFGTYYHQFLEERDLKIPDHLYFSAIFIIKLAIAFFLLKMPNYTPSWCNDFTDGPVIPIINGLLGVMFWFRVCHILEPVMGKGRYVNMIADHTYSIMMNQFLGFFLIKFIFSLISIYTPVFKDFDQTLYHTDIFYYFLPHGQEFMLLIYVATAIIIPVIIDLLIETVKDKIKSACH